MDVRVQNQTTPARQNKRRWTLPLERLLVSMGNLNPSLLEVVCVRDASAVRTGVLHLSQNTTLEKWDQLKRIFRSPAPALLEGMDHRRITLLSFDIFQEIG
jgi:hypothetical protein